jgi:2-polyprenyl-6-methoxyphenol hydroxylase-like FAD-dependent oxidoreductase
MGSEPRVLVVGAGPTGLTLACELARRNVPVWIVDRSPEPFAGSRGKGLQPRTMEVLDDLDVVEQALAWGTEGIAMRTNNAGQPPVDTRPHDAEVRTPDVPYPKGVIIPQWRTERILRERLAVLGVSVRQSTELVGFEQSDDHVTATLRGPDGEERIDVDHLVGCDGGHSMVRKALGVGFAGETPDLPAMIIADLEVTGLDRGYWHTYFGEAGFIALCPFAGIPSWQIQAVVAPDESDRMPQPSLEVFRKAFADIAGEPGVTLDNPTWLSTYRVNERMVDAYRVGRVFLAGDAAHVHSPAGGLGMNTGIQDAYNLGWKLAMVVSGQAEPALLDTYEQERLPIAAWTLGLSGERLKAAIDGFTAGRNGFAEIRTPEARQLGLGYPWSSLSVELVDRTDVLRAGDRAPDAPCVDTAGVSVRLFDLFRGPHFTLLGFGAGCTEAVRQVAAARPDLATAHLVDPDGDVVDGDGHAVTAYGITGETLVLVRPDGYVGLIGAATDADAVVSYLDHCGASGADQTDGGNGVDRSGDRPGSDRPGSDRPGGDRSGDQDGVDRDGVDRDGVGQRGVDPGADRSIRSHA